MQVQAYLFFAGRCEEAIGFYRHTLGAEVIDMMRFKDAPGGRPKQLTADMDDKIMNVTFRIGDTHLMASDGMKATGNPEFKGITLSIEAADDTEVRRLFDALREGGKIEMPLEKTFWTSLFGGVEDRFGVSWFVVAAKNK